MTNPLHAGVVYLARGEMFLEEARVSAASVRRWMPGLPVTLFCDRAPAPTGLFDDVVEIGEASNPFREKLRCLARSPYERTLFLDTDTYLLADVSELFDLLGRFDLAATHDRSYTDWFPPEAHVPAAFRELNTGVVAYRRSEATEHFFAECLAWYERLSAASGPIPLFRGHLPDQPAFRAAVYHSQLRLAALTFEYNCRFPYFGYASGAIRILHGREFLTGFHPRELERAGAALNAVTTPRVFVAGDVIGLAPAAWLASRRYVPRVVGRCFRGNWRYLLRKAWSRLRA